MVSAGISDVFREPWEIREDAMRGMEFHVMKRGRLAAALGCACLATSPAMAQQAMPAQDASDVQVLARQLEALKASYAQEVRRLRELDMQVQALQARLSGKLPPDEGAQAATMPSPAAPATPPAATRGRALALWWSSMAAA